MQETDVFLYLFPMLPPSKPSPAPLFNSLRWNFLLMGGIGILSLVLLGILAGNLAYRNLMEAERVHLEETANMAANSIELLFAGTSLASMEESRIQHVIIGLKKDTRFRFTLIKEDGTVIADSDADPRYMENHAERPEVALARIGRSDFELRYSHTLGMDTLYFARPWQGMILRAAMPLHFIVPLFASVLVMVLIVCSAAVLAILIVSWRMYQRINIPIHQILQAARAWEENGESPMLYVTRPQELAGIARALKRLAEKLKGQIEDAELRERELQYLFGAIREAVLVVDQNQIIYRYNNAAYNFIDKLEAGSTQTHDSLIGMHLLTFIRSSELAESVSDCDTTKTPIATKITLYGNTVEQVAVYVAPLALSEQGERRLFIIVLYVE